MICKKRLINLLAIGFGLGLSFTVFAQEVALNDVTLSAQEQTKLDAGKVVLKGKNGEYIGQVLATGNLETAWEVITDYNNFENFLPNIIDSKILTKEGNKTIFEQTSEVDLFLFKEQFTVRIAAIANEPQKVNFEIVKGDLKQLQGTWEVSVTESQQILVTHTVAVEPASNTEKPFFYGIYESSLEKTLNAIAQEITKRSKS